jgi:hypothetical protein
VSVCLHSETREGEILIFKFFTDGNMTNDLKIMNPEQNDIECKDTVKDCVLEIVKTSRRLMAFGFIITSLSLAFGIYVISDLLSSFRHSETQLTGGILLTVAFFACIVVYVYPLIHLNRHLNHLKNDVNNQCDVSYEEILASSGRVFKLIYTVVLFTVFIFTYVFVFELPLI